MPPEIQRLSKESYGVPPSPTTTLAASADVGKKMMTKLKIGGKKLGAATKNTIDKLGTGMTEKRTSGDSTQNHSGHDGLRDTPSPQYLGYTLDRGLESPMTPRFEAPRPESRQDSVRGADRISDPVTDPSYLNDTSTTGLGLATPVRPYALEGAVQSTTSFSNLSQAHSMGQPPHSPASTVLHNCEEYSMTPMSPCIDESAKAGRSFSATISGGKVSKLLGYSSDSKVKHHSDSSEYPQHQAVGASPKQKSKFSKFVNDLSNTSITGSRHNRSSSHSGRAASPLPPPPPDKSQFQNQYQGGQSKLKGFLADLNSRDITGAKRDKSASPHHPSPRVMDDRPQQGGLSRLMSDLNKRDITGNTEESKIAAARARAMESTHLPAQPVVYDDTASDWEVKMAIMEEVLPHISHDILVEALMQSGGDEQRAIGLAVIKSRA